MSQSDDFRKAVETVSNSLVKLAGIVKEQGNKIAEAIEEFDVNPEGNTFNKMREEMNNFYGTSKFSGMSPSDVYTWFVTARAQDGFKSALSAEQIQEFLNTFRKSK